MELEAEKHRSETNPEKARQVADAINKAVKAALVDGVSSSHPHIASARQIVLQMASEASNRFAQQVLDTAERLKKELALKDLKEDDNAHELAANTIEAAMKRVEKMGVRQHLPAIVEALKIAAELREIQAERKQAQSMAKRRRPGAAAPTDAV
eukprot:NODE_27546_length_509_cov_3.054974.p2 GENE.NODE_27546_length_509_cov_3.054974~~NODE_27546_length_509_cov_3.054974.p2  ORF type:complete len:153 (-),score=47.70 NODE_27546_length_509_cov_3.054974:49-507(-)